MQMIEPQLDQLIEQCDDMMTQANSRIRVVDDCIIQSEQAEKLLTGPLRLQNRLYDAEYEVR